MLSNVSLVLYYTLIDGYNVYYRYSVFFAIVKHKINFLRNHFARCICIIVPYIHFLVKKYLNRAPNNLKN